ncbi:XVIPCD domain-containing protein [Stenotrophomonas sp. YIM B06876]|uniref:XVIPCD domain-containing protein n=1 Tax=Stenotrophomonas sp. YIM B06876 TaxID=3060211 RepID=UPI0027385B82|nr:XVIPCD domain-containing protein [Stenotrophomonas sp. YIM B06876]
MPEFDINTSANEVVALLQQGRARHAAAHLETLRHGQPRVIQEALDRFVASRAEAQFATLRQANNIPVPDAAIVQPLLDRVAQARLPPRFPSDTETDRLTQAQLHDIYASIVAIGGNDAARETLTGQDRVILGLRQENRTTQGTSRDGTPNSHGNGVYDDRIVVLWTDASGERHAQEFHKATTEPTAQYDGHAKTVVRSPGFEDVITRPKTQGSDVNGDGVRDLGRLAEGTTEMLATTHPRTRFPDDFSLRPSPTAIVAGTNRVERDSNGDGWFDARDVQGVQHLNNTFKIHRGGKYNTDSAGCQTIENDDYDAFVATVRGTPGQTRWQYVLTSVAPEQTLARDIDTRTPLNSVNDPRMSQHPDHQLLRQIDTHLQALGGLHTERAEVHGLVLLHEAKARGITRVDQIVVNNATATRAAGETLFLVQGGVTDPAAVRIAISAAELATTSIDISLRQLQEQAMQSFPSMEQDQQHHPPHVRGH